MKKQTGANVEQQIVELLEDEDFLSLDATFHRTNLFQAIGMETQEIRHSNFIAWLLDPNESHGLGDTLIKLFLTRLFSKGPDEAGSKVLPDGVSSLILSDLSSSTVTRESESNTDILFKTDNPKLVLCMENKVWSGVGDGQLDKYWTYVESRYARYPYRIYVLLTPSGNAAPMEKTAHAEQWIPFSYDDLRDCLNVLASRTTDEKNLLLIRDYIDLLERKGIVETAQIDDLVDKLYRRYPDVFDLVENRRSNARKAVSSCLGRIYLEVLEEMGTEGLFSSWCKETTSYLWFHTKRMDGYLASHMGESKEGSWGNGATYHYYIYPKPVGFFVPSIRLELGPFGQGCEVIDRQNKVKDFFAPNKKDISSANKYCQVKTVNVNIDEREAMSPSELDAGQIKKALRTGILSMLEWEDKFFSSLEAC